MDVFDIFLYIFLYWDDSSRRCGGRKNPRLQGPRHFFHTIVTQAIISGGLASEPNMKSKYIHLYKYCIYIYMCVCVYHTCMIMYDHV